MPSLRLGGRPRLSHRRRQPPSFLLACSTLSGADAKVSETSNWNDVAGADVLIITAGIPRKPGQSRDDLVASNLPIIRDVADNAKKFAYYPDKKAGTFDKQNVRDGHYVPWAPTPYMAKKAADGTFSASGFRNSPVHS